jgi:hypothetical protein
VWLPASLGPAQLLYQASQVRPLPRRAPELGLKSGAGPSGIERAIDLDLVEPLEDRSRVGHHTLAASHCKNGLSPIVLFSTAGDRVEIPIMYRPNGDDSDTSPPAAWASETTSAAVTLGSPSTSCAKARRHCANFEVLLY